VHSAEAGGGELFQLVGALPQRLAAALPSAILVSGARPVPCASARRPVQRSGGGAVWFGIGRALSLSAVSRKVCCAGRASGLARGREPRSSPAVHLWRGLL